MTVEERAALDALAHTTGWAIGPVKRHGRHNVTTRADAEEIRLELWFRDDELSTIRVRALLAMLGKESAP